MIRKCSVLEESNSESLESSSSEEMVDDGQNNLGGESPQLSCCSSDISDF